jgi:hypothetical protein
MSARKYLFTIVILVHLESIFHSWKHVLEDSKILLPLFDD